MNLSPISRRLLLVSSLAVAGFMTACSDSSSSVSTTSFDITPSLGIVYNGTVQAYSASGVLLGTGSTGTTGKATIAMTGYTAGQPVVLNLVLTPGVTTYFNEAASGGAGAISSITSTSYLTSVLPSVSSGSTAGITPATHLAAKIAGVSAASSTGVTLLSTIDKNKIYDSVIQANRILGLPDSTNLLKAPVPASPTNTTGGDAYGKILAVLARTAPGGDPITQAATMWTALTVTTAGAVGSIDQTKTAAFTNIGLALASNSETRSLATYSTPKVLTADLSTLTTINSATRDSIASSITTALASGSGSTGSGSGTGLGSTPF